MTGKSKLRMGAATTFALGLVGGFAMTPAAMAQDAPAPQGAVATVDEEIVVTATKRGDVLAQDVPGAITAFSGEQLQALNFQTLQSLTYTMPNVQLEDVGTAPGVANFGIRGLAINSSIPSVDPTVGVFVDGIYYGINAGIVVDNFDLEAIEVLRGPQGVLFGRNVTGGAILIRTRAPTEELTIDGGVAVETGPEYTADVSISGAVSPGLSLKAAAYHNEDEGWFENDFDGSQFGASNTSIYRLAARASPSNDLDVILRLETGDADSDGPASQNIAFHERGSFDFTVNNPGYAAGNWEQATLEANLDVPFGDGMLTNVWGWRNYEGLSGSDIDGVAGPPPVGANVSAFHARAVNFQEQWSNELRYAGTFGTVDLTAGLYWFKQTLLYVEERSLFGAPPPSNFFRVGGGQGTFTTSGFFANADWHLNDQFTVNLGIRYSDEDKDARVSRIRGTTANLDGVNVVPGEGVIGGDIDSRTLNFTDSPFNLSWTDTSPRVGIQWEPSEDTNVYAFWAQGFRSGGVNFRTTTLGSSTVTGAPQAFDSEEQSSFEVGWKQDFADRRGRFNLAVFHNTIEDMQRETNISEGAAGVQQVIVNSGTAIIQGAEIEARWSFTENFLISMQVGYTDGEYDEVTADLDALQIDCVTPSTPGQTAAQTVGPCDLDQEIPRLAPWTYGANVIYDLPIMGGVLSTRVGYNHRDEAYYNDSNLGVLAEADIWDANISFRPGDGHWSLSIYGENLTDEATWGGDTNLPDIAQFGGPIAGPGTPTFSPLNEGQVIGAALRVHY
jgi:iron complex outermembrane recepter protein